MRAISAGVGRAAGAVAALGAGVDLLCIGNPDFPEPYDAEAVCDEVIDAVERAVADGVVPASRLEEAAARVAGLADTLGPAPAEVPSDAEALEVGTGHRAVGSVGARRRPGRRAGGGAGRATRALVRRRPPRLDPCRAAASPAGLAGRGGRGRRRRRGPRRR